MTPLTKGTAGISIAALICGGILWLNPTLIKTLGLERPAEYLQLQVSKFVPSGESKKCILANGDVIYGTIAEPYKCQKLSSVDTNITVVANTNTTTENNGFELSDRLELSDHGFRNESVFNCDGRTHCSEMTSCAEARFFLANCTNMKVDGDDDGIPCERQWC